MSKIKYYDYADVGDFKFGEIVKLWNGFYKIIYLTGNNDGISLACRKVFESHDKYKDLNHDFIKLNLSIYEFNDFVVLEDGMYEIRYKLFLRASQLKGQPWSIG